jgi:hypothetical protein
MSGSRLIQIAASFMVCVFPCVLHGRVQASDVGEVTEYEVKAAFIYQFIKFVEWPDGVFKNPADPVVIGVLGDEPFDAVTGKTVRNKTVRGRKLTVRRIKSGEKPSTCHVLFCAASTAKDMPRILKSLEGSGILTIGDAEGLARQGLMINFVMTNDQVHFEINVKAAKRAGFEFSSKLLNLAAIVGGE